MKIVEGFGDGRKRVFDIEFIESGAEDKTIPKPPRPQELYVWKLLITK